MWLKPCSSQTPAAQALQQHKAAMGKATPGKVQPQSRKRVTGAGKKPRVFTGWKVCKNLLRKSMKEIRKGSFQLIHVLTCTACSEVNWYTGGNSYVNYLANRSRGKKARGPKHHEEVFVHGGLGSGGHLGRRACQGQRLLVMVFVQPTPTMVLRHARSKKVFSHTPVHTTRHGFQPVHSRDPVKRFIARAASAVESASSERCGIGSYGL